MKRLIYIFALILASSTYSCKSVTDDEVILYNGENKIYFVKDSIKINLAELPVQDKYEIKLPITVMGFVDYEKPRPFEFEILSTTSNGTYTTPKQGEEYELATSFMIDKDSINGYINVTITGANVKPDKIYELNFKVKENNIFGIGVVEKQYSKIVFINFLEKPTWWDVSGISSPFKTIMLSKLFEVYGKSPITDDIFFSDYMGMMSAMGKVSDWLDANPQFGVFFNDIDKEYFKNF